MRTAAPLVNPDINAFERNCVIKPNLSSPIPTLIKPDKKAHCIASWVYREMYSSESESFNPSEITMFVIPALTIKPTKQRQRLGEKRLPRRRQFK